MRGAPPSAPELPLASAAEICDGKDDASLPQAHGGKHATSLARQDTHAKNDDGCPFLQALFDMALFPSHWFDSPPPAFVPYTEIHPSELALLPTRCPTAAAVAPRMVALKDMNPGGTFIDDVGQRHCLRLTRSEQATKETVAQKASRRRARLDSASLPGTPLHAEMPSVTEPQAPT